MSEVVTFIPDAGGSIVINGKCFFIKISLISGISDTKIGCFVAMLSRMVKR